MVKDAMAWSSLQHLWSERYNRTLRRSTEVLPAVECWRSWPGCAECQSCRAEKDCEMKYVPRLHYLIASAMRLAAVPARAAPADDVAAFYNGKNLNLVVGFNAGGGADLYARLIARHFGKHIPGHPNIVVRNMPGAGSMGAANHLFNVSPRDGLEIGLFAGNIVVDPVRPVATPPGVPDVRVNAPASETSVCLEQHQIFAQQPDPHGRTIGARDMLRKGRRDPVAAHQRAHRRPWANPGQRLVFMLCKHGQLRSRLG